jgi:hypothetical protein
LIHAEWRATMRYRILAWAAISWIAVCLGPYVYALNDLITWRYRVIPKSGHRFLEEFMLKIKAKAKCSSQR